MLEKRNVKPVGRKKKKDILGLLLATIVVVLLISYNHISRHSGSQWTMLDMFYRYLQDMSTANMDMFQQYTLHEQDEWGFETLCFVDIDSQYYDRDTTQSLLGYQEVTGALLTDQQNIILDNVVFGDENHLIFLMPVDDLIIDGREMRAIGVNYNSDSLFNVLNIQAFKGQGDLYVIHDDGTMVFRSVHENSINGYNLLNSLGKLKFKKGTAEKFRDGIKNNDPTPELMTAHFNGQDYYLNHTAIGEENWVLVSVIPVDTVSGKMQEYTYESFLIMCGVCAAIIIVFAIFYNNKRVLKAEEHARKAAESANQTKTNFFTSMSHDIRTPMNAIIGMTDIALSRLDEPDKVVNCLRQINSSGKMLIGLINDILDMAKIESGRMEIHNENASLAELIENMVIIAQPIIKQNHQKFEVCLQDIRHEQLMFDQLRMKQVLINLLSNAMKFTPEGGSIKITVTEGESQKKGYIHLTFTVADTGIGMSQEFLENIFDMFSRDRNSRVDKTEGNGLGMAITNMIIKNMGGSIQVQSKQQSGSTFTVELDVQCGEAVDEKLEISPIRVLLADSNPEVCRNAKKYLNDLKVTADTAGCGREAIDMAAEAHDRQEDYHLIILEWQMGDYNGCETASRMREKIGSGSAVILSSCDWNDIEAEAAGAGVDGFVRKPFFKSTLYQVIKQYVQRTPEDVKTEENDSTDLSGKHVLLVEDNLINQEIMKELLGQTKVSVTVCGNGKEAAECFKESPFGFFDLILMDIQMPVMNGYEATRVIRGMARPDAAVIPIFALTANAFAEDIAKAKAAGMDRHISKPIDMPVLLHEMNKVLTDAD